MSSSDCGVRIFSNFELSATDCYPYALSKVLGYVIIAASFALKLPQIMKIWRNKSVAGLSFLMFALDLFGYVFQASYAFRKGFPLDTYAEVFVLFAQNFIIVYLFHLYGKNRTLQQGYVLLAAALGLLAFEMTVAPMWLVWQLQSTTIAIFSASKIPQIVKAYNEKSTGQLDFFMVFLQMLGSLTRVFTTYQSVADPMYLLGFIIGATLSGIMCAQIVYYGKSTSTANKVKKAKSKKAQ